VTGLFLDFYFNCSTHIYNSPKTHFKIAVAETYSRNISEILSPNIFKRFLPPPFHTRAVNSSLQQSPAGDLHGWATCYKLSRISLVFERCLVRNSAETPTIQTAVSWFASVPPGKFQDSTLKLSQDHFFLHPFQLITLPIIRKYAVQTKVTNYGTQQTCRNPRYVRTTVTFPPRISMVTLQSSRSEVLET
jgi:hypothetical protein